MKRGKIINERWAVCTMNDKIMVAEYDDGATEIEFEYHMINDRQCQYINNCNKDRNGNYYTTSKIITLSDIGLQNWKKDVELYNRRSENL